MLPLWTHHIEVELSEPLRMEDSGGILGSASQSCATCPASSKLLIEMLPDELVDETRRQASSQDQG